MVRFSLKFIGYYSLGKSVREAGSETTSWCLCLETLSNIKVVINYRPHFFMLNVNFYKTSLERKKNLVKAANLP